MNRYIPARGGLAICAILLLLTAACSNSQGFDNARAVKIAVLDDTRADTAAYIRRHRAAIDSMPLHSDSDCRALYKALNRLTFDLHLNGDDSRAITLLHRTLNILQNAPKRSIGDTHQLLNTHVRMGATFADMGMPALSVDYYQRGLEYCNDTIYNNFRAMLYNNLGIIYGQRNMLDRAEQYFSKSLAIDLHQKEHEGASLSLGNLAEVYTLKGQTEKALETLQRSLDYTDQRKHPEHLARMRIQQGSLYAELGQPDLALQRYKIALKQYTELDNRPGMVDALLHIGDFWLGAGQADSAMKYTHRALEICRQHERDDDMVSTLRSLSDIHRAKGDYLQALDLMTNMTELSDSLREAESRLRLTNWSESTTEQRPAGERLPLLWLVALLLVSGTLLLTLVYLYRQRRENRDRLQSLDLENKELTMQTECMQREMTSLSLEKLKLHEGLNDISECLRTVLTELSPRESEKRDTLRRLLARVNNMADFDANEEFKLFFGRVHPNFYNTLSERFPDLTPRDIRLCAFLYLGMTTKEIAVLTYREIRSVDSARNRLRKKLGLELNDDLTAYMRSI